MTISDNKNIAWKFIYLAALIFIFNHHVSDARANFLDEKFNRYQAGSDWEDRIVFPDEKDSIETRCQNMKSLQECMDRCPASDCVNSYQTFSPVCGTNDITYGNIQQMQCARICGVNVGLRQRAACDARTARVEISPRPPTLSSKEIVLQHCLQSCPSTPEYSPVCGTDRIMYHNIGKLLCANRCGVDVKFVHDAPCEGDTVTQ